MLEQYLKTILDIYFRGDAREESYYSTLEALLENYLESSKIKNLIITSLPKKTEGGNPDFRIWDGKSRITGYIEAKSPDTGDLGRIQDTPQLKRYLNTFPNLILTNFMEFRLYKNNELVKKVEITRPIVARRLKTAPPVENEKEFFELLDMFLSFSMPKTFNAKTLAWELAKRTRFLKDEVTLNEIKKEEAEGKGPLLGFYEAFKKYLIHDISKEDFADLYSQTIAYGLFAARTRAKEGFSRRLAFDLIPRTIGILREVFRFISSGDLPKDMEWIVDDISEVLSNADVNKILHDYFSEGKGKDPIVHFYETFLPIYDPETRERRGVYYTPEPVVSYIVRSLDIILRESFKKEDGFATDSVTILDPAAGTLTFPAEASRLAVENFTSKYGEGAKDRLIKDHILKNFYAFELMMAPYAIGHIKMGFLLEELGYRLKDTDRFKLYLTNTLEMEEFEESYLPFMAALSEESHLAGKVKKDSPILVIMGNPPYSGISTNVGEWITKLIEDYKYVDGKHFGERKHWLQDDYVKFIRFAQWKIDTAGKGVIGLITNHGWLDNPTFRGMRQSLMQSFDEIYILNLHGNSLKKEKCPDGSEDKNVFDIRQGVAISLFVKKGGKEKTKQTKISYADIWGSRDNKYRWLEKKDFKTTKWKVLNPTTPSYFFIPRKEKHRHIYESFWKITDIFPVNVTGIVTARDHFVIDFDKNALKSRIMMFRNKSLSDEIVKEGLNLKENYMWRVAKARKELMDVQDWEDYFTKILYRPFDIREIYFHPSVVWRTRKEVMRHMMRKNLSLCVGRAGQVVGLDKLWNIVFCSKHIEDLNLFYRGGNVTFPLYLYEDSEQGNPNSSAHSKSKAQGGKKSGLSALMSLFEEDAGYAVQRPNISKTLLAELEQKYKKAPSPEEIFHYIYAVLYSNGYRAKYAEFLKTDFPRVPFTKDYKLFVKLADLGKGLAELHLMESSSLEKPVSRFQGKGDAKLKKLTYSEEDKRVNINDTQFFEGIEKEVWGYQVGGYRVMEKWLKDRKGKTLSMEDIRHYCRIATAISETIAIQRAIDKIYPKAEDSL